MLKKEEWKNLWKLKIQERLELNLWKIARNIILTESTLNAGIHHIGGDDTGPRWTYSSDAPFQS